MKNELEVNTVHEVDFIPSDKGVKPICRINGIVGIIDDNIMRVKSGESWKVNIDEVKEKHVIVSAMARTKTREVNEADLKNKLKELGRTFLAKV